MRNDHRKQVVLARWLQACLSALILCLLAVAPAGAETISTASLKKGYTAAELDQMLAPVALYPDGLLLQVLMASSYPAEVVEAGRWLQANPDLGGDAAVAAAESFGWNASVRSLLPFPDVLLTMSSNMDWTVKLGSAFTAQREDVMARVQHLRRQARATGNLKSDERMNVLRSGNQISIEPTSPEVIYVPYYNPAIVYGAWEWPGYRPYYWSPWRGYAYYPGYYSSSFMWGSGIWFSYTRFHGRMDWHRRRVHWNPPLKRGTLRYGPGYKPRPDQSHAWPGSRPGQNSQNQAFPGGKGGHAGTGHMRPGYTRPGHNRPSASLTNRPGQRPGPAAAPSQVHKRPVHAGQPSRNMAHNRPSTPQGTSASPVRHSPVSQPRAQRLSRTPQAASPAQVSLRPAMAQQAGPSRQGGERGPRGMAAHRGGHKGGPRR